MSLFSKHKEADVKEELPPLKFPELPPEKKEKTEISQKEEKMIKEAVAPARAAPGLPAQPSAPPEVPIHEEEKPLFVKVEKYKEVVATLNEIKSKLKDANDILAELNKIKEQEDHEISSWHDDLEAIKSKLLSIDKALFEL